MRKICPIHRAKLFTTLAEGGRKLRCPEEGCTIEIEAKTLRVAADPQTLRLRNVAHKMFDQLWTGSKERTFKNRRDAYRWLAKAMNLPIQDAHFAAFDAKQCHEAIGRMQDIAETGMRGAA